MAPALNEGKMSGILALMLLVSTISSPCCPGSTGKVPHRLADDGSRFDRRDLALRVPLLHPPHEQLLRARLDRVIQRSAASRGETRVISLK